ncbi:MAG TPA: caspase family protein [Phnomibacter sp.]|nr:caspase family protein [Phnomibacter sp.]
MKPGLSVGRKLLWLLIGCCALGVATAQTKRALLIGIGTYPDTRWKSLSSANDLHYLKSALQLQGFAEKNTVVLVDEQATHNGIATALEQMKQAAKPGDIVYIHFSGHGQQIEDDAENPDEADGYDEALVPYDARGKYDPVKYYGQNHFRDDELGKWLEQIRTALGADGSLLVVIDACHSGTATRSVNFAIVRGDPVPFASPEYIPKLKTNLSKTTAAEGFMSAAPLATANMVVFSASSPNQVNYETHDAAGKGVGSLSYAIAKALQRMPSSGSYADLFSQVKAFIQSEYPQQLPMMEGDGTQKIFAGNYLPQLKQIRVDKWTSDTVFVVNMGELQGVYPGTVVKLLDPSTKVNLGNAVIQETDAVSSIGKTNHSFNKAQPYIVEVVSYASPGIATTLRMVVNKGVNKSLADSLKAWIKTQPRIQESNNAEFQLELTQAGNNTLIELVELGDAVRWNTSLPNGQKLSTTQLQQLGAAVKASNRTRYLRSLPDGGPAVSGVQVFIESEGSKDATNEWKLKPGAPYTLHIVNNSETRLYFNLLNILPSNVSQVLLPQPGEQAQDYSIGVGDTFHIEGISVDEDAKPGKEFLRVVLRTTSLDLRPVFEEPQPGSKRRSVGSGFEKWLDDGLENTGASRTRGMGAEAVTVVSTGFTVIKN